MKLTLYINFKTECMKRQLKKWALGLTLTGFLIAGLLLTIVLNPFLTYANKTTHNNFTIYHNSQLDPTLVTYLDQASELLKTSEYYNDKLKLDICLNDGSQYPNIIRAIRGQAFAWGFYDKVVLQGTMNCKENFVELNGYKWNLTQLLAHEMTHCLQFDQLGFWNSKPIAKINNWKWEGYAEYISRQNTNQKDVLTNINKLQNAEKNTWEIILGDNTITSREYYNYWTLVQYCLEIKKMSYKQLLADRTSEHILKQEMINWFKENKNQLKARTVQ